MSGRLIDAHPDPRRRRRRARARAGLEARSGAGRQQGDRRAGQRRRSRRSRGSGSCLGSIRWTLPRSSQLARREARRAGRHRARGAAGGGVADALPAAGVAVFGPTAAAARIEIEQGVLPRDRRGRRRPDGRRPGVRDAGAARAYAHELAADGDGVVVKADGLAAGKGVTVCDDAWEAARRSTRSLRATIGGRAPSARRRRGAARGRRSER